MILLDLAVSHLHLIVHLDTAALFALAGLVWGQGNRRRNPG